MQASPFRTILLTLRRLSPLTVASSRIIQRFRGLAAVTLLALPQLPACSGQTSDLTQKSLEDLMNIEVTSVSKKEQKTSQVAAAVFVISREDIRNSGALNVPDLLRMVPGLDVAQIDGEKWAISIRGFNGQYSNKLLVMVDGRTVYSPIFAGVFWDSQNFPLDGIERIEVIRGPGAAVWGSNAVNGVINIITLNAGDTKGGYIASANGNVSVGPETIRYGGRVRNLADYRISAEGFHHSALLTLAGLDGQDAWRLVRGGFRTDSTISPRDSLIAEGEIYRGNAGEIATTPLSLTLPETATVGLHDVYSGWNLLSGWNHTFSPQSKTSLQIYFDRTNRGDSTYSIGLNTFYIDFQHHVKFGTLQDVVWGLGYRVSSDHTSPALRIVFAPKDRLTQLFSFLAQDEITVCPDRLQLSLGARIEHNDYTGIDFQPSVRLVWIPDSKNSVWGAVSAADRIPARSDTNLRVNFAAMPGPGGMPLLVSLFGNPGFKNERLTAFELGYRSSWTKRFSLDSTIFYNRYRDLASVEPGTMSLETNPAPSHLLIPSYFGNGLRGETHGTEAFLNWKPATFWTLCPGYAFLSVHLHPFAASQDFTNAAGTEGGTPDHQVQLRSNISLPHNVKWNVSVYFVNRLPAVSIPSYTRADANLIWRAGERVSIRVAGQNLLKDFHPEYAGPNATVQTDQMRRAAYAELTWSF